jgi:Fe-S cluster biogenesis protein NfuA
MTEAAVIDRAAIESALDEIRPFLHGDGNVEIVDVEGGEVRVRLSGSCADCSMQQVTLRAGIERIVRARVPAVGAVVAV